MPDPIGGAGGVDPIYRARTGGQDSPEIPGADGETASFEDTLKQALGEVESLEEGSQQKIQAFIQGQDVEVHEVMAAAEEAGIALDMLIEVRNKFVQSYRTLINMQQ